MLYKHVQRTDESVASKLHTSDLVLPLFINTMPRNLYHVFGDPQAFTQQHGIYDFTNADGSEYWSVMVSYSNMLRPTTSYNFTVYGLENTHEKFDTFVNWLIRALNGEIDTKSDQYTEDVLMFGVDTANAFAEPELPTGATIGRTLLYTSPVSPYAVFDAVEKHGTYIGSSLAIAYVSVLLGYFDDDGPLMKPEHHEILKVARAAKAAKLDWIIVSNR